MPLLEVRSLDVFYGDFQALHGISVGIDEGGITAIIGANGAGKTTLLGAVSGIVTEKTGDIIFAGYSIISARADEIARAGIAMVPEGRCLYQSLSVEENLLMGTAAGRSGSWTLDAIYDLFPALCELRRLPGTSISGGEQQMVALGRALLSNPQILLCDELSLGLAPKIIDNIYACFERLLASGLTILIVEQDVRRALSVASNVHCLLEGQISLSCSTANVEFDEISRAYFGG
jgi:branched-chain amino acid transport system ATP-binding protein